MWSPFAKKPAMSGVEWDLLPCRLHARSALVSLSGTFVLPIAAFDAADVPLPCPGEGGASLEDEKGLRSDVADETS